MKLAEWYQRRALSAMSRTAIQHATSYFGTRVWLHHIFGDTGAEFVIHLPDRGLYRVRISDGITTREAD